MRNAFKYLAAAAGLWLAFALPAFAQSSPSWTYGYVPTTAQWNSEWASKQDFLGAPPLLITGGTMTGPIVTAASATTGAGLNIPPGAAPTSPNNGDFWSTSIGFYGRVNGVTVGPFVGAGSGTFAATSPITVSFPSGVVTYAFNFLVANTFLAQQTDQGATTTSPGWYAQLAGDTVPRVRVGLNATDVPSIAFGPGNANRDLFIERAGAASIRLGAPDAASPIAQTFGVQNVVAGTSNVAGAALTIAGSIGTGTGAGGNIVFQVAPAGSSGTAQNSLSTALSIFGADGGLSTGAATDQGAGTLNLAGSLYNNGTAPTGTGGYVRATSPSISSLTVTGSFTATGLVTNSDLANTTITVNGTVCILGSSCAPTATAASITVGTTTVASSTSGHILYNNAGTLGDLPITGSAGNVVLSTSPSISGLTVTSSFTATGLVTNADLANASVTINGATCTLGSSCMPASTLIVGTSPVNSGSNGYFLYDMAGTLGNLGTTGTAGLVVLSNSPTIASLTVNTAFTATGLVTTASLASTSGTGTTVALTGGPTFTGSPILSTPTATSVAIGGCTIGSNAFCVTGFSQFNNHATVTSSNANAFAVGPNGATNPAFNVDASTASAATGLNVKAAAATGGLALSVISSGSNENLTINAFGTGTIGIGSVSTGAVTITPATTITGALTLSGGLNTPLVGTYGGTGVNNGSNTITVAGNFSTSAALAITAGTTGQLAYWSSGTAIGGENIASALTAGTNISITGTTNATISVSGVLPFSLGGTNNGSITASNGGIFYSDGSKMQLLAGTATAALCLQSQSNSAPIWASCTGGASVSSVSNSDGTLTISPTTGSVVASLALGHANTWTAAQTFSSSVTFNGSVSGAVTSVAAGIGLSGGTITSTGTLSVTNPVTATVVTVQRFTSGSGTYTPAAGVKWIEVIGCGAGGGGGATTTNNGTDGGATTFGTSLLTANGGAHGIANNGAGGAGGTASGGNVTNETGTAGSGQVLSGTFTNVAGGQGGASVFGGTASLSAAIGTGGAANGHCSGGNGGYGVSGTGAAGGGGGAGGFFDHVMAASSESYAVGSAGSGGAAGANAGGNGAGGLLVVIEHYNY
jgi:hypothetical protein